MIPAEEFRKIQQENIVRRQSEYSANFKNATDKYYQIIINEAQTAICAVQNTNRDYVILNHVPLIDNIDNFSYSKLLYGSWNRYTRTFDDSIFEKHGTTSPFSRAVETLDKFGYILENISKETKPYQLHLKISW
jgi:hypothetical protein